ncbi:MAG TPA: hypothetical protein VMT03_02030 [Polyangia bacterium]|nr:hypothetical protein [Polyangia bacterium]
MAKFTIRVELHGVEHDSRPYRQFHDRMAAELGWSRTIRGGTELLPPAEYQGDIELPADTAADAVEKLAREVPGVQDVTVLVTRAEDARHVEYRGRFDKAPPVFHSRGSGSPGRAACGASVRPDQIRPARLEAEDEVRRLKNGARLCTLCFKEAQGT